MTRPIVYTDMGADLQLRADDGTTTDLPRYGVWKWDARKARHQVAEVGDDLKALQDKHGEGPLVDFQKLIGTAQ